MPVTVTVVLKKLTAPMVQVIFHNNFDISIADAKFKELQY